MSTIVEFPLDAGGTVLVDVDDVARIGAVRRGIAPTELITRADQSVEAAFARVKPAAAALVADLRSVADPPDQIEVTFGIRLSGEVGAVIAKTAAEANFSVRLSWSRPKASSNGA
ncbi:MAG: hypothetical protein QOE10_1375 [Gaiellales bacterium]|nr:hypothetical protein [Gaiellales bacterium]